jgi:hypothetical protein
MRTDMVKDHFFSQHVDVGRPLLLHAFRPLNCMLPGPFNVPEIWHCVQISNKKIFLLKNFLGVKRFLHLKMLKSAPKCPIN